MRFANLRVDAHVLQHANNEPKHTVTFIDACEDTTITVANGWEKLPITVRAAGGQAVRIDGGQEATLTVAQTEPYTVEIKRRGDTWDTMAEHIWARPEACNPYAKPDNNCDGWTLQLVNPKALDATPAKYTLKLEPMQENIKLLWTVKAGGTESLALGKGVSAKVKIGRGEWANYKWQTPEGGCQSPSPSPTTPTTNPPAPEPSATAGAAGGDDEELAKTGVGVAGIAGIGGVLLVVGAATRVIRKRRIRYTA